MSLNIITINGKQVAVEQGTTVLAAARKLNIHIPTLCHLDLHCFQMENHAASCRICVVEVEGRKTLAPSCATPATDGMVVYTSTPRVLKARRAILELLLSDHPFHCLTCSKNLNCDLQSLAQDFNIVNIPKPYMGEMSKYKKDTSSKAINRDLDKCIMCRRCEAACNNIQTVGTLTGYGRGFQAIVGPAEMKPLANSNCTFCGQCVNVCPTGALGEMDYTREVWSALYDKTKTVIVQTAPAIRVALGEEFGVEPKDSPEGKMVAGLKALGFDNVFDTNFGADLTIMEEATELIERIKSGKNLPMLTSCCPGWISFLEFQFPDLLNIPSSCKSPMQMTSAMTKTYYAKKLGMKPEDIVMVAIMPCLAKKYEAARPEFNINGGQDTDYVITTRELVKMFKEAGINPYELTEELFDNPLGEATGAGSIFGATGGVLEAALRTANDWLTGKDNLDIDFEQTRGLDGVKEASVQIGDKTLNVAMASGLGNARKLLEKVQDGTADYHVIEIMACPGGCINGGGQPFIHGDESKIEKRREAIYAIDAKAEIRKSHLNPSIQRLYREFLGKPGGEKSHALLHTKYNKKSEK
ncbi:MAG: [FeFe] hydrogenase, group A [Bacteriovoracaceae bacterium]|nr:[FeFe] hydrogenase, group A [Bacteriovoracaceae bacterium]